MTHIYLHKLTVTVITTECSPDAIERLIDKALSDAGMRGDARTDAGNRMRGPSVPIVDPPAYPVRGFDGREDTKALNAWADAHDTWLDSWPTIDTFAGVI